MLGRFDLPDAIAGLVLGGGEGWPLGLIGIKGGQVASHECWDGGWAAARFCRVAAHFSCWLIAEPNGG